MARRARSLSARKGLGIATFSVTGARVDDTPIAAQLCDRGSRSRGTAAAAAPRMTTRISFLAALAIWLVAGCDPVAITSTSQPATCQTCGGDDDGDTVDAGPPPPGPPPVPEVCTPQPVAGTIAITGTRTTRLSRTLVARPGEQALDRDGDALVDTLEGVLADAYRPYLRFDSQESALRRPFEPVTIFQVRPEAYRIATVVLRIRYLFLFRRDGGYGPASGGLCIDDHMGDIEESWLELTSNDRGTTWEMTAFKVGWKDQVWPARPIQMADATHPVVYLAGSKHHTYLDTSYDGNDSLYSDWWCNDDVNGQLVTGLVDLHDLERCPGYLANVGEPERDRHREAASPVRAYFVNELEKRFFTEQADGERWPYVWATVWNNASFYWSDGVTGKLLSWEKPHDLGYQTITSEIWTYPTSDEDWRRPVYCPNGFLVDAVKCEGSYCDDVSLHCRPTGKQPVQRWWTPAFSEEGLHERSCTGGFVTGLRCTGDFCDSLQLECTTYAGVTPTACQWQPATLSEEQGTSAPFGGAYVAGVRCTGSYCDNLQFYTCRN